MKNFKIAIIMVLVIMLLSACQPAATPTAVMEEPTAAPTVEQVKVFEFITSDGASNSYTLTDIQSFPSLDGQAGIKSSTGKIFPPTAYTGLTLKELAAMDPNFNESMGLVLSAVDGYSMTFSYDQVMNGTFTQYDPGTGDELKAPVPATAMLAYSKDGKALDPQTDGYLRLVIASDEAKQVTDGHWSVKFVTKAEIKPLAEEWSLHLEGAINELMDRATFESGSAPKCHGVSWTDEEGQEWAGIALWLLVGRVDDEIKHEGPAFNDKLAESGYTVDVVATDGYSVTFDISKVKRNDNILVAYKVDGNDLPEKYFPLRLVGSDLSKKEMVGSVEKIIVNVPQAKPTEQPTVEATKESSQPVGGVFAVSGLVANPLNLSNDDLEALGAEKISAEHPKKGVQEYEGVRFSTLLEAAGIKPEAKKLVLVASDGYKAEVFMTEIQACPDCMVAFSDTAGSYSTVMPGLPGNVWVKNIVSVEAQ
jgi:DMSO/TMAO reductase YedYZ molybdopterin-dependent catalytic subunit